MDRCTGHCCRAFTLSYAPDELARLAKREGPSGDAFHVYAMALHIGKFKVNPVSGIEYGAARDVYACLYYDADAGDCRGYDERPRMCREYPYGDPCREPDCTWKSAQAITAFRRMRENARINEAFAPPREDPTFVPYALLRATRGRVANKLESIEVKP